MNDPQARRHGHSLGSAETACQRMAMSHDHVTLVIIGPGRRPRAAPGSSSATRAGTASLPRRRCPRRRRGGSRDNQHALLRQAARWASSCVGEPDVRCVPLQRFRYVRRRHYGDHSGECGDGPVPSDQHRPGLLLSGLEQHDRCHHHVLRSCRGTQLACLLLC